MSTMLLTSRYLDLGHSGPTSSDSATAQVGSSTPSLKKREDHRRGIRDEPKPQESAYCLSLVATLSRVVRAVRDFVTLDVGLFEEVSTSAAGATLAPRYTPHCHSCVLGAVLRAQCHRSKRAAC